MPRKTFHSSRQNKINIEKSPNTINNRKKLDPTALFTASPKINPEPVTDMRIVKMRQDNEFGAISLSSSAFTTPPNYEFQYTNRIQPVNAFRSCSASSVGDGTDAGTLRVAIFLSTFPLWGAIVCFCWNAPGSVALKRLVDLSGDVAIHYPNLYSGGVFKLPRTAGPLAPSALTRVQSRNVWTMWIPTHAKNQALKDGGPGVEETTKL
ncbi:hypothetical protein ACLOJK_016245 [Asimina triloba]